MPAIWISELSAEVRETEGVPEKGPGVYVMHTQNNPQYHSTRERKNKITLDTPKMRKGCVQN